jgi:hypothetical protein
VKAIKTAKMKNSFAIILALILILFSPLAGIWLRGESFMEFLTFPPMSVDIQPDHAPFSPVGFIIFLAASLLVAGPFVLRVINSQKLVKSKDRKHPFPIWGWVGIIFLTSAWIVAWSRFPWMQSLQTHTFAPLWIGYIVVINAFTFMHSGKSLLSHNPVFLVVLLLISSFFWWYFEYLNLFTENWYYVNVDALSRQEFFWYATLPFATVLPAVISTKELLQTFPGFSAGLDNYFSLTIPYRKMVAWILIIGAAACLAFIPLYSDYLFFMLWLAPLVIMISAQVIADKLTLFSGMAHGNWKQLYLWGMAALMCGFFWEMWNYYSYTRWEYAIPFAQAWHIFEMPLPGYAGYLPFGIQCGVICKMIENTFFSSSVSTHF